MSLQKDFLKGNWINVSTTNAFLIALVTLTLIDLLFFNQVLELRAEEPRRAIVTFEMLQSGNWIVPHIHDEVYYNKPPLFNWVQGIFMFIFGNGEWSARLPGTLSFLTTGFLIFYALKRTVSREFALLGTFAYITSVDLLFYGSVNTGEIDLFYSLIIVVQALVIFKYRQSENYFNLFFWSYLLTGIGVLTKGIPSLAFQAITLLAYFTFTKRFLKLLSWQHLFGILLLASMIGGYLYLYDQDANAIGFLARQFKETSQRSANEFGPLAILLQFIKFPFFVLSKLLPWSLLLLVYLNKSAREFVWKNPFLKFAIVFVLSNISIYWISPDVRVRYIYMFFPFLIILFIAPLQSINWEGFQLKKVLTYPTLFTVALLGPLTLVAPFIIGTSSAFQFIAAVGIAAIFILTTIIYYKQLKSTNALWIIVFILLTSRLAYNALILPEMEHHSKSLVYRSIVNEMVNKSNGEQIYLSGKQETIKNNISFLGTDYANLNILIPPTIPYQVPYYYAKYTGKVLKYKSSNESNTYYLSFESDSYQGDIDVIYTFYAENKKKNMILYKIK